METVVRREITFTQESGRDFNRIGSLVTQTTIGISKTSLVCTFFYYVWTNGEFGS